MDILKFVVALLLTALGRAIGLDDKAIFLGLAVYWVPALFFLVIAVILTRSVPVAVPRDN
jgi:hypothetical protein